MTQPRQPGSDIRQISQTEWGCYGRSRPTARAGGGTVRDGVAADEPRSVSEIADHFAITQQAVSLHLKVLREAGLVGVRRDGQRRLYLVDPDGMASLQDFFADLWPTSLDRLKHAVEADRHGGPGPVGA